MYKIKFKAIPTKQEADIRKEIVGIIENLKEKFGGDNRGFNFEMDEKDGFVFDVVSDGYTATDLLVQFDKQVRVMLGKKFKITIKDIEILDYIIEGELEKLPKEKFELPFVEDIIFKDGKFTLKYVDFDFGNLKKQYVEKTIKLIREKIAMEDYEGKGEFKKCLWEGTQRNCEYNGDPAVDLEEMGWIKRTEAKGQFIYGRKFTALVNVIKELLIENIYSKLGFYEMGFPKFEPWIVPEKSGHAKNIYPEAYFVSVPKNSDPKSWQDVMDLYAITGEIPEEKIREKSSCVGIMSYAQCPPFWPFLKNRIIDKETLPLLVYDWSGATYRNESGGTHGIDRLEEFNRIETLYVGTREQIVDVWKKLKEEFVKFYDEVLDLEIKVYSVAPWWMAHAGVKTDKGGEDYGTFDIDAYLPYRGGRDREWLEIQNVSSNGDKYPKAWNVKEKNQDILWSGCAGTGIQRVMVAFLAQKGLDIEKWPKIIQERFKEKTKGINNLKFY